MAVSYRAHVTVFHPWIPFALVVLQQAVCTVTGALPQDIPAVWLCILVCDTKQRGRQRGASNQCRQARFSSHIHDQPPCFEREARCGGTEGVSLLFFFGKLAGSRSHIWVSGPPAIIITTLPLPYRGLPFQFVYVSFMASFFEATSAGR